MSFDAGAIQATAEIDTEPFQLALVRMDQEARKYADKTYKAKLTADSTDADAKIDDTDEKLRKIGTSSTRAKVTADTTDALLSIAPLTEKLEDLRDRVSTAKVDANTDDAKLKLEALDLTLRRVGTITAKPRVSVQGIEEADIRLDAVALKLEALSAAGSGSGGRGGGFLSSAHGFAKSLPNPSSLALAVGAGLTTVGPLAGLVAGAGASLITPITAATIGITSFGLAAKSTISKVSADTKTLTADQQAYNAATSDKTRAAAQAKELKFWQSLPAQEKTAIDNLHKLSGEWSSFQKSLQPEIYPLISGGVGLANSALKLLLPTATATGKALDGIEKSVTASFGSPFWKQFFGQFLPGQATKATDSFATSLGHLLAGGAHLVEDFAPLGGDFESDLERLTKRFESWTEGSGPSKFVDWVHKNGPTIEHDVGSLISGIAKVSKGLIPLGTDVLHDIGDVANVLGKFSKADPRLFSDLGAGLLATAVGLKAIAAADKAITVLAAVRRLTGSGAGGGVPSIGRTATGSAESGAERDLEGAGEGLAGGAAGAGLAGSAAAAATFLAPVGAAYGIYKGLQHFGIGTNDKVNSIAAEADKVRAAVKQLAADQTIAAGSQANLNKQLGLNAPLSSMAINQADAYGKKLLAEGEPLDEIRKKVDAYVLSLQHVPGNVHTLVTASTAAAEAALRRILRLRQEIKGDVVVGVITAQGGRNAEQDAGTSAPPAARNAHGNALLSAHPNVVGSTVSGGLPPWLQSLGSTSPNAPSSSSSSSSGSSASKGPTASTVANGIASIVNYAGLTFVSDLEGTAKEVRDALTTMVDKLNAAVRNKYLASDKSLVATLKASGSHFLALTRAEKDITDQLTGKGIPGAGARANLATLRSDATSAKSTNLANFRGLGDIGSIVSGTSVSGIVSVLGQQDKVAVAFARNLGILRKKGLSDQAYLQLLNAGPGAVGQEVAILATASAGQIHAINRDESELGSLGKATGVSSASYLYGARITKAAALVTRLVGEEHALVGAQRALAKSMEKLVKDGLSDKGTHSALATIHADNMRIEKILASIANAPKAAVNRHNAHVRGA